MTISSQDYFEGRESEKTGRKGKVNKGPHQTRLGRALPEALCQQPSFPSFTGSKGRKESSCLQENRALRSALAEGSKQEPPRRAQLLQGSSIADSIGVGPHKQPGVGRTQTRDGVPRSSTKP